MKVRRQVVRVPEVAAHTITAESARRHPVHHRYCRFFATHGALTERYRSTLKRIARAEDSTFAEAAHENARSTDNSLVTVGEHH
jgi:hypothetical protein